VTAALLAGAAVGLGAFLLVRVFVRPQPSVAVVVARLDAGRRAVAPPPAEPSAAGDGFLEPLRRRLGERLEYEAVSRGWRLTRLRSDLSILGRSLSGMLATKVFVAVGALLWMPLLWLALSVLGVPVPPAAPAVLSVGVAVLAFFLPDLALRGEAEERRKDFRHVVGSFLDLVAMNLAGGRGLPEALLAASAIGDHWALARIRQALTNARLLGETPWDALGRLGDDVGVDELRDLAGALSLAGDEGAKIRASLSARAASLRRKELADAEGAAGERSQSMLIAQMLICAAFLVFLAYPATYRILNS
jgi:Flp pilus assembly protein TadB